MNEWERNRRLAERYRETHPPGTRIKLLSMDDPFAPVPAGTRGTVVLIDDQSQLHMKWDNGSGLALIPGEDSFRKLTPEELAAEQKESVLGQLTEATKNTPVKTKTQKKKEDVSR